MPKCKYSREEREKRRKEQQRQYYLKKKEQKLKTQKNSDLTISAEQIQKNWVRIQRSVFTKDVQDYFAQLYKRKLMKVDPNNSLSISAIEDPDSSNSQKKNIEIEHNKNEK